MGCGDSCVKYILFFFNLIFALCGLAILGIGVAVKVKFTYITDLVEGHGVTVQPLLFIVIGAIIFIVSFFGCCGAVRESHCMLVTYAIFMIIIIIAQVILAIIAFVYMGDIDEFIRKGFETSFKRAYGDNDELLKQGWDTMQEQFECCGVTGIIDYTLIGVLPKCNPLAKGCYSVVAGYFKTGGSTIAGIAIGVAVVEIASVIFSLCFANTIRNQERRYA